MDQQTTSSTDGTQTTNIDLKDLSTMIRQIMKEEHENLKADLNSSIASYTKPFFDLYDKNFKNFEVYMQSVNQTASEALSTANKNKEDIRKLETSVENITNNPIASSLLPTATTTDPATSKRIDELEQRLATAEEDLDDMRNRSMRGNLVFHGLLEEEDNDVTTKDLIANFLHAELGAQSPEVAKRQLVRAHRSRKKNNERRTNPRPIFVKFARDDLADEYLKTSIDKRLTNRGLKVTKQFTRKLQARINSALQRRRELVEAGEIVKGFVEYPAILKGQSRADQAYRTIEVF